MRRNDIINHLIKTKGFHSYLEIGVDNGSNYFSIECDNKECCDPYPLENRMGDGIPSDKSFITYPVTSDEMFANMPCEKKFDLIFIDGLHHKEQVMRDIENAMAHLNNDGIIVCHDNLPENEMMQKVPRVTVAWCGDVWKATYSLIEHNPSLKINVVDTDYGCSVIEHSHENIDYSLMEADYNDVFATIYRRDVLMNVISVETFLEMYS